MCILATVQYTGLKNSTDIRFVNVGIQMVFKSEALLEEH